MIEEEEIRMFEVGHNLAIKVLTALSQTTASTFSCHHLLDLFSAQRCSGRGSHLAHLMMAQAIKVAGRPQFSLAERVDQSVLALTSHICYFSQQEIKTDGSVNYY